MSRDTHRDDDTGPVRSSNRSCVDELRPCNTRPTDVVDRVRRPTDANTQDPIDVEEFGLTFAEHFRPGMTVRIVARLRKSSTIRLLRRPDGEPSRTILRPDKYAGYVVRSGDEDGPGNVTTMVFVRGTLDVGRRYVFVGRQQVFASRLRLVSARLSLAGEDATEAGADDGADGDDEGKAEKDVVDEEKDADGGNRSGAAEEGTDELDGANDERTTDAENGEVIGEGPADAEDDGVDDRTEDPDDGAEGDGGLVDEVVAFFEDLFGLDGADGEPETTEGSPTE